MKSKIINKLIYQGEPKPGGVSRRDFIKHLGGGVVVVYTMGNMSLIEACTRKEEEKLEDFNAYLRITEDGIVECFSGKIEMGQGITTSLTQIIAEELEVPMKSVKMILGDTELCPFDEGTWGSMTTRFHDPILRAAAAEAREALLELAAKKLKVPQSRLRAKEGVITDSQNPDIKIAYRELTTGQKIVRTLREKPVLKKASEFNIIGKPFSRIEAEEKVTGKALYSGDIRLPGMKYAAIKRPAAIGSKLKSADTSAAEKIEGIEIVREGDLVAVLHDYPETALQAVAKIKAEWDAPESKADDKTIFKYILDNAKDSNTVEQGGDLEAGKKASDFVFEEEYHDGYKAHASIETHTATAEFKDGTLTMWTSSQTPFGTRQAISETLKLPLEKVHLKQIYLGGGFGGKIYNQQAIETARIAILSKKPVQLIWSRKEEFLLDTFHSAGVIKIRSGATRDGKISLWDYNVYCTGDRGANLFYNVPNNRTLSWDSKAGLHPFPTGAWRAPGNNMNTFARESQIDIMAYKLGIDPVEFRLKNMKEEKAAQALRLAAEKFGWKPIKSPSGKGWGVAVCFDAGTYAVTIAEVKVNKKTGQVQTIRCVVAQQMGQVVNPLGATLQIEGSTLMGLGYSLTEDLEFDWGKVKSKNFDDYHITRFSMIPRVESYFTDSMDEAPQGGGEPAIVTIGAAIGNAIFDACGARLHQLPMTPERVMEALSKT